MNKKIKAGILAAGDVVILAGGIGFGLSKMNKTKVDVYQVGEIKQSMWGESNSLEGIITSSVSQKIQLQDNQIVEEVFVQEGQSVVEGTPLLSYDMTLVNIDLEMEKLNREQLKIKKKGLENTLEKLKKKEVAKTGTSLETYEVLPLAVWNSEINLEILPEWKANVPENPEQPEEPQEPENPQEPEEPQEEPVEETMDLPEDMDLPDEIAEESGLNPVGYVDMDPLMQVYLERLKQIIMQHFNPPSGLNVTKSTKTSVQFTVDRFGNITDISLRRSSGNKTWDNLSVRAIKISKLPELPPNYRAPALSLNFNFTPN